MPQTSQIISIPPLTANQENYLKEIEESQKFSEHVVQTCTCKIGGTERMNHPPCPVHGRFRHGQVRFDPDLSPDHSQNKTAARARNWRYDAKRNCYVDVDGAQVADKFGQRY